ncbi:MAG: VOC family protein [Trueperaceae bacterium]|nr:VOC family protein [Trueperaceae bacterium]
MHLTLDHLLYAGPELDRLVRELARTTGATPVVGGKHAGQGTHNALLGLGADTYLELIAPDPDQDGGDFAASIDALPGAELHAWCVRTDDADELVARIRDGGHGVVRRSMSRVTPEGDELRWELIFATGHAWAGAAPFFIAWGETPHPAARLAQGASLRSLTVLHPEPGPLRTWLAGLGLATGAHEAVAIEEAPGRGLRADLSGRRGPLALRGGAGGIRLAQ